MAGPRHPSFPTIPARGQAPGDPEPSLGESDPPRPAPPEAPPPQSASDQEPEYSPSDDGPSYHPPPKPIEKGSKLARYLILDKLGEGGMGVVYAAYDPELDRKVALKILSARFSATAAGASAQARLQREAQAMARVSHPNVIAVHEVGKVDDQIFVAMELVDGGTLNRWFKDTPRTWREILHTFVEAGRGLSAAHAVGLVHRDFKPDNVLVSRDGRVRVTDFGLARLANAAPEDDRLDQAAKEAKKEESLPRAEDAARMLEQPLTQAGAVMGTPAYMSPEQHMGKVPDARSDQFSFCAALYWAIFRKRPFDAQVLGAIAGKALGKATGPGTKIERPNLAKERAAFPWKDLIQEPPSKPAVPKWLKRALMRGLSIEPDQRYPSMEALLKELTREPRAQRRYLVPAVLLVVVAVSAIVVQQVRQRQELCSGADRKLAGVWDDDVRRSLAKAFSDVKQPWAQDASRKVAARFDEQARAWSAMHKDACEATRIRGEQSEQILSLRMICLDRRLGELHALTDLMQRDPAVLEKALDAAYSLTSLKGCADVAALTAPVPRPEDPAKRAKVEAIEAQLAQVKAQYDSGKFNKALEVARAAVADARALQFAPTLAEALQWAGWLQDRTGDPKVGEQTLKEALLAAEAGRHDEERLRATAKLIWNLGLSQLRYDDASEWVARARALLERLGHNPELEVEVLGYEGALLTTEGKHDEAIQRYRRAIELADQVLPPEHPRRSSLRSNLASVYARKGDLAEAMKLAEEALASIERSRGPEHPTAAYAHYNLAIQRRDAGDLQSAHQHIQRALEIRRAAFGPDHRQVAEALDIEATLFQKEGKFEEASADAKRSLEIRQKVLGPDHPDLAYSYENLGQAYLGLGRAREAMEPLEKAIAVRQKGGLDEGELSEPRFALAKAVWAERKDRKRARSLAVLARDGYAKAGSTALAAEVAAWIEQHP